ERFDEYSAAYKRLSAAEKEEFAKVIAANKSFLETYDDNSAASRESTARLRTAASVQDYEKEVEISAAAFVKLVIFTGFHVSDRNDLTNTSLLTSGYLPQKKRNLPK